jgi:hypothetical protein
MIFPYFLFYNFRFQATIKKKKKIILSVEILMDYDSRLIGATYSNHLYL